MSQDPPDAEARDESSSDIYRLKVGEREFILVGTAHISQESVDLVRNVIASEHPDTVCIELDIQRFEALRHEQRWASLDLRDIIRERQLSQLIASLILSSYQRRLGLQLGVTPGSELLAAAKAAEELDIPVELCDRDVRITLRRAWAAVSWWRKALLVTSLAASAFETPELSEEELRRIRQQDVLSELMRELGDAMPALKKVLIDERDAFLAEKIRAASGNRIVAVVGAGHVEGMLAALRDSREVDLEQINELPTVSPGWKWVGWGIPALILGSITWIGITRGVEAAGSNALYWFLANAIPTGVGGILALAHPATIAAAALAAPFTSLTPLIGAGYVAAFVQAWIRPPTVRDFQTVGDDLSNWRRWWSSRLLRIFLVFLLTTFGSVIGTWVGGVEVISNLF